MPLTFILLQATNAALAAASLWLHFKNPFMWDDQAIFFAVCAGTLSACLTAIILGITLIFRDQLKWGPVLINLLLALGFGVLQGYLLFQTGRDLGVFHFLKARLG